MTPGALELLSRVTVVLPVGTYGGGVLAILLLLIDIISASLALSAGTLVVTYVLVTDVLLPAVELVLGTSTGLSVVTLLLDFSAIGAITGVLAVMVLLPPIPRLLAPV